MNREDILKVRDALWLPENSTDEEFAQFSEAFAILDRELAKPDPEPVVYWNGDRSVIPADEVSYIPNWTDYYPTPLYRHPAHQSAQAEQYEILVLPAFVDGEPDAHRVKLKVGVQQFTIGMDSWETKAEAESYAACFLNVLRKITAPPSREWQGLTDEEVNDLADAHTWYDADLDRVTSVIGLTKAISEALRAKNSGEQFDESARCKECGSFACGGECVRRYENTGEQA